LRNGRSRQPVVESAAAPAQVRCAIYTRKSTDEGLSQEFNSLDAQREAAEAYIASQRHEGWVALPDRYDDGGFTGANMERPGLQRLLADIEAGRRGRRGRLQGGSALPLLARFCQADAGFREMWG
jgi:site-specific DNA recombinase